MFFKNGIFKSSLKKIKGMEEMTQIQLNQRTISPDGTITNWLRISDGYVNIDSSSKARTGFMMDGGDVIIPPKWDAYVTKGVITLIEFIDGIGVTREIWVYNHLTDLSIHRVCRYEVTMKISSNGRHFVHILDNDVPKGKSPKIITNRSVSADNYTEDEAERILLLLFPEAKDPTAYWEN